MKNNLLFRKPKSLLFLSFVLLFLLNSHLSVGQNIAVWDAPNNGSDWPDPLDVTTKNSNVTVTAFTRGSGLGESGTPAGYSYGGSGADQSTQANAITNNDFFTMTVKANTGYRMSLTGIPTWFTRRSGTGTCTIVGQYSLNGGAYSDIGSISVTSTSSGGSSTPLAFPAGVQTALANLPSTTTVTFRFVVVSSANRNIYFLTGASGSSTARFVVTGTTVAATPSVNLSVSSNTASEASPASITVTATASSAVSGNQTVNIGVSGTGITSGDYILGNSVITILNGQTTGTTTFTVVDDAEYEGTETATLTISSPSSGLVLGTTTTQNITITDNDLPPNPMFTIGGTLAHGAVCPTVAATTRTYTITNSGTAASDVVVASGDPQFVVSNLSSTSIGASNGTATYDVTFTPTSNGAKSSVISVYYNTNTLAATTTVTGTGTTSVSQAVTSSVATVVTAKTATLNGNVTTLGICPASTQKGFVYSKSGDNANPENQGENVTTTPVGSIGTGAFTLALTGLSASTQYSFKAYVFNGTAYTYEALQAFTTSPALSISGTLNNGTLCPNFTATPQTYTVTNNSIVTVSDVEVSSSDSQFVVSAISSTTIVAGGTATYTITFTPSSNGSKSTTITVSGTGVVDATNSPTGTGTTPVSQAVTSSSASSVVNTTATLNGVYNTAGVCPSTNEKGFVYSVKANNSDPLVNGEDVVKRTVTLGSTGAYAVALTGLTPSTLYTFKAYVYNGTTYTYGAATDFTTLAVASKLVFSVAPPTAGTVSTNLTSFTVQAQRPNNTVDTEYNTAIALTRSVVSGAASLTGTTTVTPTSGVATFTSVQFNGTGVYKISASSGGLTATPPSANITVTSAPVSLAAWNFSATMMNGAPPTPVTNANITVGALTRGSAVTTTGTNYTREWGGYGWSTSTNLTTAANAGSFLSFTIKANANYLLSLNNIPAYDFYSSNTGPGSGQWQYSINGGAFANVGATLTFASSGVNSFSAIDLSSVAALQDLPSTTTVTFRIVGYDSGSTTSGTFAFYDSTASTAADFSVVGNIVATPIVNLSVSSNTASEASPEIITVTATANAPVSGAQTVNVSVSGTNIMAGDYTLGSGIITIADGEITGTTTFIVVDDALAEDTETAVITISNPSSGIVLGTTRTQSITILDNDIPPPTFGGITQTEASCDGSAGTFTVSGLIPSVSTTITYTTSTGSHTETFTPNTTTAVFNSVALSYADDNGQLLTVTAIKRNDTNQEVNLSSGNTVTLSVNPLQTPTVGLTSSDLDNVFAYGTGVTFTAAASGVSGNTGIVYDFKVNGVSRQSGSSNSFTTTTISDQQQVSVSISVTGGTCMQATTASSNIITNTVSGAVLVYISNFCGQTLPFLTAPIYSTTAVVSGTPTVQYQFRVKRVGGASETLALRNTPGFNLTQSTLYAYNASYEVYVSAVVNGVVQPESSACTITTPAAVPPATVQSTYCGSTLADAYSPIFAATVPGATGYRFDVFQGSTHITTVERSVNYFYLTNLPSWTYNTSYTVYVAVKINNEAFGGFGTVPCTVTTPQLATPGLVACGSQMATVSSPIFTTTVSGATNYAFEVSGPGINTTINRSLPYFYITGITGWNYGTTYTVKVTVTKGSEVGPQSTGCLLTTPSIPGTSVKAAQCDQILTNAASPIYAEAVYGATGYRFHVSDGTNETTVERTVNYFSINTVSFWQYNKVYSITVEAVRNNSVSPVLTTCSVTTPEGPFTTIPEAVCNNPELTRSGSLSVNAYPGASSYLFVIEEYNDESVLVNTYTKVSYTNSVALNTIAGLPTPTQAGITYAWGVQVAVMGKYGEVTKGCSFTLIPTPSVRMAQVTFSATAYPNPFASDFMVNVKTNSQSVVNVKVYDMVGRLVEQRDVKASDMESTNIGNSYPSGVYNVVVSQDDNIETVRVIKR